jgi:hypothetical protein
MELGFLLLQHQNSSPTVLPPLLWVMELGFLLLQHQNSSPTVLPPCSGLHGNSSFLHHLIFYLLGNSSCCHYFYSSTENVPFV